MKLHYKNRLFYFIIIIAVAITGCESLVNDLDESELPHISSKLVVESFIGPSEDSINVIVTESSPLFGEVNFETKIVQNATVTLSNDTKSVQIPWNGDTRKYTLSSKNFTISPGKTYYLTVTDPTRKVTANCTVPLVAATFNEIIISSENKSDEFRYDSTMVVKISWNDIPNQTNYYSIRGYAITRITEPRFDFNTNDVKIAYYENVVTLSTNNYNSFIHLQNDINLDGSILKAPDLNIRLQKNDLRKDPLPNGQIQTYYTNPKLIKTHIEILNLEENYYKYHRSHGRGYDNDNPFVEPTLTFTNIEGGLGCFGAYNATVAEIEN